MRKPKTSKPDHSHPLIVTAQMIRLYIAMNTTKVKKEDIDLLKVVFQHQTPDKLRNTLIDELLNKYNLEIK